MRDTHRFVDPDVASGSLGTRLHSIGSLSADALRIGSNSLNYILLNAHSGIRPMYRARGLMS